MAARKIKAIRKPPILPGTKRAKIKVPAYLLQQRIDAAITLYEEAIVEGAYDSADQLQKRVFSGSYIRQDHTQRRLIRKYFPSKTRGRPKKDAIRILVSFLAAAYAKECNNPITLNRADTTTSSFEAFLTPILNGLGIFDVRDWIVDHIKSRKAEVRFFPP